MKLKPKTRGEWLRFVVVFVVFLGVCANARPDRIAEYYLSEKKEGDILFQSLPHGDLVDAIEGVTKSEWSHCGILLKRDGEWYVAEAIGQVRYTPLTLWMIRGRGKKVVSYRLKEPPKDLNRVLSGDVDKLIGRPYDFRYAPGDEEIYCSELVYKVYERAAGIKIGEWEKLGTLNWAPHERLIREMEGGDLPLERPMITPVGLTRSPLVRQVF